MAKLEHKNRQKSQMQNSNSIIGKTIGDRYHIIGHLGGGGFCQTYLALDTQRPGEPKCAVKHLKPVMAPMQMATVRFNKEAEILEKLGNHDRIPRLLAHFEQDEEFYLVQEFIEGQDLSKELLPGKQLGEDEVVDLLRDILEVLEFVQQHNVIHRDLKPANIMRRQDGKIFLIDFGAVKEISTQAQGQTQGFGTLGYMPREQMNGYPKPGSDIYAVGAIAIQALTGASPTNLEDLDTGQIVWRDRVEVSDKLGAVLDKMVCPEPSERYQSATEVLQALNQFPRAVSTRPTQTVTQTKLGCSVALTLFFSLAVAIALPTIKQAFDDSPPPTLESLDFLTYENSNYGFKIKYPPTWKYQTIDDPITGEVVKFLPPSKGDRSESAAQVVVKLENLPEPMSLAEYADSSTQEIRQFLDRAIILNPREDTLGDRPAYELTYKGVQDGVAMQKREVGTLWQDRAYIVTYQAEAGNYSNWEPTARQIIDSFELLARED